MKRQKQANDIKIVLLRPEMGYPDWYRFLDYVRSISCIAERLIWERTKDAKPAYLDDKKNFVFEEDDPNFDRNIRRLRRKARIEGEHFELRYPDCEAYKMTDEYQDLKKLVVIHQLPQVVPHNFKYLGLLYSDAFAYLWDYIRDKLKVTQLGIDMIQREYDKFLDEAKQAAQHRQDQRAKIKNQLNQIGG